MQSLNYSQSKLAAISCELGFNQSINGVLFSFVVVLVTYRNIERPFLRRKARQEIIIYKNKNPWPQNSFCFLHLQCWHGPFTNTICIEMLTAETQRGWNMEGTDSSGLTHNDKNTDMHTAKKQVNTTLFNRSGCSFANFRLQWAFANVISWAVHFGRRRRGGFPLLSRPNPTTKQKN